MGKFSLRSLENTDSGWVTQRTIESWGAEKVIVHGTIYYPARLPGFAAQDGEETIGLLTYTIEAADCEIVTINAWRAGAGVGTALIEAVKQIPVQAMVLESRGYGRRTPRTSFTALPGGFPAVRDALVSVAITALFLLPVFLRS